MYSMFISAFYVLYISDWVGYEMVNPRGSAMFSSLIKVALKCRLGQRIGYMQHIAAIAVIEAVRTKCGHEVSVGVVGEG